MIWQCKECAKYSKSDRRKLMERTIGWRRKKNFSKARKKKRTATDIGVNDAKNGKRLRVKCDGQYIKGKIPIYHSKARRRTNNRGFYGSTVNWKHRDAQKVLSMDSQEEEFNNEKEVKDEKC